MEQSDVTELLRRWSAGERRGLDELIPVVYARLRSLAHHRLRSAPGERSLNTTGLVHEAYLRLVESSGASFQSIDPAPGAEFFMASPLRP